ncbi:tRNA (guanosine(37)-N1)-methyltransferase TrmD [Clostridium cylindrosporum]|uniref:tRNA (guanine-N(1)-)-methyltransferase n=1 Tax=Clostridium cylindrosporum DSM 605 TaxID=1121307 RepID=A0A0J8DB14_CLOCY|nr:tRNA (guanosine(37)-N1)-methyltransferase TrmD [Clostridium cylindrosporum]KMT21488.1 tRNA (guanine-N(1)-)-methyltransferase TrmD [Clostridium cylindrosporum DSM 605]
MKFDILTLFPEMFTVFESSIIKRAKDKNIVDIKVHDIRDFTTNKHRKVDDYPYGGGAGMVMQAQPIYDAIDHLKSIYGYKPYTIYLSPRGRVFKQEVAKELSTMNHILFLCGHYEGIDERVMDIVDDQMSIGDFVLTGGEIPTMVIIDSVSRLIDGVLSKNESYEDESFSDSLLEYPQYTRPEEFRGKRVPDVLLSGHHAKIDKWRREMSLKITYERRPDLLKSASLSKKDIEYIKAISKKSK